MGTKREPGPIDCYAKAEDDEPMFVLLARDPMAPALVEMWARERATRDEDPAVLADAQHVADQMRDWWARNREPVGWESPDSDPIGDVQRAIKSAERPECPGCGSRGEVHRDWCSNLAADTLTDSDIERRRRGPDTDQPRHLRTR